jgi:L-threonylcarbamoyladenylate synthase
MHIIPYDHILQEDNLFLIRKTIGNNGVIIYPTDTLYGIGGNFFSLQATAAVDAVKKRDDMPYSVAVSGMTMLESLVETIPGSFHELYEKLLPGKFTFLFKASRSLNKELLKNSDKIGIRVPNVPNLLKMIEIINTPLISTSVNRSGEPPLNDPAEIIRQFSGERTVSLLIDGGILPQSKGSTILDITETPIRCLRRGDGVF